MNYQHMFRGIAGVTLSLVLLGLLSLTAYAAGPVSEDAYQAIPAADHCAGISSGPAGSSLLAANPELSAACRFVTMRLQKQAMVEIPLSYLAGPDGAGTIDEAQRARQAETARYSGLAEAYASRLR